LALTTECGRYTIDAIFLNREELVEWRKERRQARRDLTIWLKFQTDLLEEREAAKDTEAGRKLEKRLAAMDRLVARSRMMYGL